MHQPRHEPSRSERSERVALVLLLAFGMLLMLIASTARAGETSFTASRTDRFTATLGPKAAVRVENISGDIVVSPGRAFAVTVTVSVSAPTQKRADEALARTAILQSQDEDGYALETSWPNARTHWDGRGRRAPQAWCEDCRITARYEMTLPSGVAARLGTVNGEVVVRDVDAELDLSSVNGDVRVTGARRSLKARTVNGGVEALAERLPAGASWDCRTVNGGVLLTFPKDAKFELSASVMSGAISSTFPLPARGEPDMMVKELSKDKEKVKEKDKIKVKEADRRRVVVREGGDEVEVDLGEIEREVEDSMREADAEMRRVMRELDRSARVLALPLGSAYSGSIGQGGASVRVSTLNGAVTVLAAGTRESDAKALVSPRKIRTITIPPMYVMAPRAPRAPIPPEPALAAVAPEAPRPPAPPRPSRVRAGRPVLAGDEDSVVRGDITGDFLSTTANTSYQIGKVSGRVRILTNGGEIHVASAGAGADLKTYGGDIEIGSVGGDFKALTMAGDVKVGAVSGSATAETSAGDVRIDSVKGALEARTAGGDVVVPSVGGALDVETGGGTVRIGMASRQAAVSIHNAGGDVLLTLPADFRGELDLEVADASPDETAIRCDYPGISIVKRSSRQQATGTLNGGGARVVVKTSSGTIRIRKS